MGGELLAAHEHCSQAPVSNDVVGSVYGFTHPTNLDHHSPPSEPVWGGLLVKIWGLLIKIGESQFLVPPLLPLPPLSPLLPVPPLLPPLPPPLPPPAAPTDPAAPCCPCPSVPPQPHPGCERRNRGETAEGL